MRDRFAQTVRTTVKRKPARGVFEREKVYRILDEGFICHVGFIHDGRPVVIPTGYGRSGDNLFIHGSAASRMLRTLATRVDVCVVITVIDGLVLARSAFHQSMNYRSVVIFGTASVIAQTDEKLEALRLLSDHIVPYRWAEVREPNEHELKATLVLRLPLNEVSAKVRTGPPVDDEVDYELPIWAGEIPLRLTPQTPIPDPRLTQVTDFPPSVERYVRADRCLATRPLGPSQERIELQVRRAFSEDAASVAAVLEEAFLEYRPSYTPEGFAATVVQTEIVEARLNEGPLWVALQNGLIVGTVAAVSKGETLYLRSMGIVPAARGKGIGELLLKQVEDFAAARGHKRMTLSTTPFLSRAISLYESFGFQRSDEGPFDLFGTPLFTMIKDFGPNDQKP